MSYTARTAARREEVPPVKTKKASLLTKLVVLALLIGAATGLLNLRQQILTAQSDLAEAEAQVAAQKQVNADLSEDVYKRQPLHSKKAARQEPRRSLPNAFFDGLSGKSQGRGSSPVSYTHLGVEADAAQARTCYQKAIDLGFDAKEELEELDKAAPAGAAEQPKKKKSFLGRLFGK